MSFMNAKEARPVDDPKALVPFGWAPGGYHCAACSTCGEAHGGSDKRSVRCQDCAEALRDKQAAETAPTPRETADHAELADELRAFEGSDDLGNGDFTVCEFAADAIENLLSEIAALRGEVDEADRRAGAAERELADKTDSITKRGRWLRDAKEARGYHQNVSFDRVWAETCAAADRLTQAERQRDELRKALEPFATQRVNGEDNSSEIVPNGYSSAEKWRENVLRARQALANQGADQCS